MIDSAEALARLHAAGWSAGDTAFQGPDGLVWVVVMIRGEHVVRVEGPTQAEV